MSDRTEKSIKTEKSNNTKDNENIQVGIRVIRLFSTIVDDIVLLIFAVLLAYGVYLAWDTNQIYVEADTARYETYRPVEADTVKFEELKSINRDIFAWLTVYGTSIDYPVVQGSNNHVYSMTDAMGEYSAAGAIYLDSGNNNDMQDFNSIIYGHYMEKGKMFGDVESFEEAEYFKERPHGNIFYNGRDYGIEFFALVQADAYDWKFYNPGIWKKEIKEEYLNYIEELSVQSRKIGVTSSDRLILLSTCSSAISNGRHILVGRITDETYENPYMVREATPTAIDTGKIGSETSVMEYLTHQNWIWIAEIAVLVILLSGSIYAIIRKIRKKNSN